MYIVKNVFSLTLVLLSAIYGTATYSMDIFQTAQNGNIARLQELISARVNINQQNGYGETPLLLASKQGNLDIVQALITAEADVNLHDNNYHGPLHVAAFAGNIATIQALIAAGADIDLQNVYGNTPLIIALKLHQDKTADLLVDYQLRIHPAKQKAPQRTREIAHTLALATQARLGTDSPLALLSNDILLQEIIPSIIKSAVDAEVQKAVHEASQPRTPMIASALASATHDRLGAESPMALLPQNLLRDITQLTRTAELQDVEEFWLKLKSLRYCSHTCISHPSTA